MIWGYNRKDFQTQIKGRLFIRIYIFLNICSLIYICAQERERILKELMGSEQRVAAETHVLTLPLPFQGHINPMLQFSKRLASKGLKVTLLSFTDKEWTKAAEHGSVNVQIIFDDTLFAEITDQEDTVYINNLYATVKRRLPEVVAKHGECGYPISCLVYDSLMPWALDIATELGLLGATLFTQSLAVSNIYYEVHQGKLKVPVEKTAAAVEGMPPLEIHDLPTFLSDLESYPLLLKLSAGQFSNIGEADWVFFNTFNSLEDEVLNLMARQCAIKPVGPTIPSMYTDKRVKDDKDYGLSLFKPDEESCMKWLDSREPCSVVYVSFGSLSILGERQMEEIACGLKMSCHYFLWVVRETEKEKFPSRFLDETSEKGLVVTWCPQLEVLAHKSVGCFMTHCGWNSTLEALSMGVPMVAMPQWADQTTNAKFVADVWRVGVRVKVDEEGIVTGKEIELRIREVMEEETAIEIRKNSEKWEKLAKEAVDEDGSSDKNIQEFVAKLICNSTSSS
ncbi:hypothetical protein P3X46_017050 [Hevea brasiliensis]|uniref:Glycosyltransferase n=2 Tax=Hevea brasiliensis TaxID=3981 RepID=A0ABQ9M2T6_HEVBR|nr:hypothetical protein P3X46_017050 [Hevea brasiliensis]